MYKQFWKQIWNYHNRTNRGTYWHVTAVNIFLTAVFTGIWLIHLADVYLTLESDMNWMNPLLYIPVWVWLFIFFWPTLAMTVRRFNDSGHGKDRKWLYTVVIAEAVVILIGMILILSVVSNSYQIFITLRLVRYIDFTDMALLMHYVYLVMLVVLILSNGYIIVMSLLPTRHKKNLEK